MDADNWNKFCKVFDLDVNVTVKKKVDRTDIITTLLNEGEFIFKGSGGSLVMLNLNHKKGSLIAGDIKLLKGLLWEPVVQFVKKSKDNANSTKGETQGDKS